jgi:hypothetical protein
MYSWIGTEELSERSCVSGVPAVNLEIIEILSQSLFLSKELEYLSNAGFYNEG